MHRVSVFLNTLPADRKIIDRVQKSFQESRFCECEEELPASGRPLREVIFHASAVSLSKSRMLTRGYRVGSSSCGLNDVPQISELRVPLLRRLVVDFLWSTCDSVPTCQWFRTCGCVLHAHTVLCVFISSIYKTCELFLLCFSEMKLCGLTMCASWSERSCVTSCSSLLALQTA